MEFENIFKAEDNALKNNTEAIISMVESKIETAVADYDMSGRMDGVLVGFSGGADSSALLYYLSKKCRALGTKIYAAHINHCIRGEEADRDEQFCRDRCEEMGIKLFVHKADVPAIAASTGQSLEEAARGVRYKFFHELVNDDPEINYIATAHNAEDNIETVVFNMFRGSGITGVTGIPPVRGYRIIRPLIYCTKSEITGYCIVGGIPYVTDSTNADTDYTRNYIRREIIPRLSRINPQPEIAVSRLCSLLRTDDMYLHRLTHEFMDKYSITTTAPRKLLLEQPMPVLTRTLRHMYTALINTDVTPEQMRYPSLEFDHVHAALKLLSDGAPNSRISLPCKTCMFVDAENAGFMTEDEFAELSAEHEPFQAQLSDGLNEFQHLGYKIALCMTKDGADTSDYKNIYKNSINTSLDFDKIYGNIFIRNRMPGDKIQLRRMSRSVKKLFCDNKIPLFERDRYPVVCDDLGIVWIPGIGARDGAYKMDSEPNAFFIKEA